MAMSALSPGAISAWTNAFSSCSAQVTLVVRSLTYACTVSRAGRSPVLVRRTVAWTVPSVEHVLLPQGERGVGDGGVAEPLAEREQRILGEVGIAGAVLAAHLVVVDGLLSDVAGEGDRQPRWVR